MGAGGPPAESRRFPVPDLSLALQFKPRLSPPPPPAHVQRLRRPGSLHINLSDPVAGKFSFTYYGGTGNPAAVTVADITGDGKLDIVLANGSSGGVEVLSGNGNDTFTAARSFAAELALTAMALT